MGEYTESSGMTPHEHTQHIVMVCVTRQRTCERLVGRGEEIARKRGLVLHVVHAAKTGDNFLGNIFEAEALDYLFTATQLSGGTLSVIRADSVEDALYDYAVAHDAAVLVVGQSPVNQQGGAFSKFLERMQRKLPDLIISVV